MRKGRLKGRSGQPALTFFPTASVGPSVLSTCISKPGQSGRPIRKKSPVDSLIDPLLTLTSCPPVVTPPRLICSGPHPYRVDCAASLNGSKSGSTPTGLAFGVLEEGGGGVSMSQTRYEGPHHLQALKDKPGAPFKHWKKPPALAALEKPLSAHPDAPSHSSRFYGPDRSTAWTRSSSLVRMRSDQAPAMLQSH